jgi:DNA-3-methyladenine glycosylase II
MPAVSHEVIKQHLLAQDNKLHPVLAQVEYPVMRGNRDIYASLLRAIVSQQLSVKAADTIHARLLNLFPEQYPQPELLRRMSLPRLRAAGLSRQKAEYLKDIARVALQGGMEYALLAKQSDAQIIDQLTQIHGVGKWTVEMLLMFSFNRKDVFAVDDVGIQNAMRQLYRLDLDGKALRAKMLTIAERWRPYRTVVCQYLWKWKEGNYSQRNA